VALFTEHSTISGSLDSGDAAIVLTDAPVGYGADAISTVLDLNGDGADDAVYGACYATAGVRYYVGRVVVVDPVGKSGSVSMDDADLSIDGANSQDYLGMGLGGGDLDGDGYDDLLVGAPGSDEGASGGGAWYVVPGDAAWAGSIGIGSASSQVISGDVANAAIGFSPPAVADFDANGHLDFATGGYGTDAAYVFYDLDRLSDELTLGDADLEISGDGAGGFGFALTAGDFDADGVPDLAVGAPGTSSAFGQMTYWYNYGSNEKGMLYVFSGALLGTGSVDASESAQASARGETTGDLFGSVLSGATDIDGDGSDDLLVGAPRAGSAALSGRVYVVHGR
jgi:hypothetical protein